MSTQIPPPEKPTTECGQIYQLMPKVMNEVREIGKTRKNQQQGYSFRGVDDVMAAFHGPLSKHGIFYVPEVLSRETVERTSAKGAALIYTTLHVAYTFFAPDGSSVHASVVGEAMDSGDKSTNKAMSAALKYALLQIFCVPSEANEDADSESHEVQPVGAQSAKPRAVPDPSAQHKVLDAEIEKVCKGMKKTSADLNKYVSTQYQTDSDWRDLSFETKREVLQFLKKKASEKVQPAAKTA